MDELQRQLRAFSQAYGQKGKAIVERIQQLMDGGMAVTQAVQQAFQEYDVADWLDANVSQAIVSTAQDALGAELTGALSSAELLKALSTPWDGSGMTLSQKLHGASREMRQSIVETVQNQIRRNSTIQKAAQALYDGYGYGHVTRTQELPKYLNELTRWVRSSRESMTPADQLSMLKAIRKVKAQADGLTNDRVTYNHFRTSLRELMDKLEHGSEKAAQRALQTAIEEKSRYVAERIARTEAARARYDAFIARYGEDDSVAAYRWKLGSRHPAEDICDMYAHADLYGLGAGVFPKDQAPVNPAHPHCLCHYAPVYASELKGKKRSDNVEGRGNAWLKRQPLHIRQAILGVKGEQEWKAGSVGWTEKARNLKIEENVGSRLKDAIIKEKGMFRHTSRKQGIEPISEKRFIELTAPLKKQGVLILRGTTEVERHLIQFNAEGSTFGISIIFFRKHVTLSCVLEEIYHIKQNKAGLNNDKPNEIRNTLNEIDAKQYLIKNARKFGIPRRETELTKKQLESYKNNLKNIVRP